MSESDTGAEDSNPGSGGPEGLAGDLGISSERAGADLPEDTVAGTGSVGSATTRTDGTTEYSAGADGPEMDDTQQEATQSWRDEQPPVDDSGVEFSTGIDRTVGESNPAEVPSQTNDPGKNPGHSHG